MRRLTCLLFLFLTSTCFAAVPSGIPRELARERASLISDLRYQLNFTLEEHASVAPGHEALTFQLKSAVPLLIDYRGGTVSRLIVNGTDTPIQNENGHILLPQDRLRAGENKIEADFVSPATPAGKAITRYEDKDDGSEYFYTLFVPMDASMAFPCFDQPDLKGKFTLTLDIPNSWTAISNTPQMAVTGTIGTASNLPRLTLLVLICSRLPPAVPQSA